MHIRDAQKQVDEWIKTIGVRYFNELTNLAILNEEVGELSSVMARVYGDQSFKRKEEEANAKEMMKDEMADVLWVLMCLANQTGIDLEEALKANLNKKNSRDKNRHQENPKLQ